MLRSICFVVMLHGPCGERKRRTIASLNAAVLASVINVTASKYGRLDESDDSAATVLLLRSPCPSLRPDQHAAMQNLSELVRRFLVGGVYNTELVASHRTIPELGVYSDLVHKIITMLSLNKMQKLLTFFANSNGGAIVRFLPWSCLASTGLLWTIFTSLAYACTELHPIPLPTNNIIVSHSNLVFHPPFHASVFGLFEQAAGFDYRLCARRFINPWYTERKLEQPNINLPDCEPGIRWPHMMFEDMAKSMPCDFACTNAVTFARLARSWEPVSADVFDTVQSGFSPSALTMAQRALYALSPDPLIALDQLCSAQHFTPWLSLLTDTYPPRDYGKLVSPAEGTPDIVTGCDGPSVGQAYLGFGELFISGWPPKQRSAPAEALDLYRLLHDTTPILERFGIHWWADAGTLLGAWRHHGLMPQECDLDFALWHNELYLFATGGPLVKALAAKGIRVFFLSGVFRAIRISYMRPDRFTHLQGAWNFVSSRGPYLDLHMATLVPPMYSDHHSQKWHLERWAYLFFPDERYAFPKSFSLTGLLDLRNHTVVADRREKWPFGETYVYVPESGSPAAKHDDYLGKVYGDDWMTTLRERDSETGEEPLRRKFIHRTKNHSAFYALVAQPTGPLHPPLRVGPSFRAKRYDWPPLT
eukprot:GEMP01010151.1.p1 GENE.GEMP01010151.1~~GEMP01010151.1.p1  ORF type:complete len:646 (+),score=94.13 GEMP01010151.1:289-2226(+)